MALTQEDLQAIGALMDGKLLAALEPIRVDLSEVKQRVTRIEVTQENIVSKQIDLLTEGHSDIVRKLKSLDTFAEKVEDIQDTVDVLKHIAVKK